VVHLLDKNGNAKYKIEHEPKPKMRHTLASAIIFATLVMTATCVPWATLFRAAASSPHSRSRVAHEASRCTWLVLSSLRYRAPRGSCCPLCGTGPRRLLFLATPFNNIIWQFFGKASGHPFNKKTAKKQRTLSKLRRSWMHCWFPSLQQNTSQFRPPWKKIKLILP